MGFQLEHRCHYNAAVSPDLSVTSLPLRFLSVTEAVISSKLKRHPCEGWKMTNHKRAGVSLGLCPQSVKTKPLLRASRTPPQLPSLLIVSYFGLVFL